jgi:hypothetical protein
MTAVSGFESPRALKIPAENVLDDLCYHAYRGYFDEIETILEQLVSADPDYAAFCDTIDHYAEQYDNKGILAYIHTVRS